MKKIFTSITAILLSLGILATPTYAAIIGSGTNGPDTVTITSSNVPQMVSLLQGNDKTLSSTVGGTGVTTVYGGRDNDELQGVITGPDALFGDIGNDFLDGQKSKEGTESWGLKELRFYPGTFAWDPPYSYQADLFLDKLTGGPGADTFRGYVEFFTPRDEVRADPPYITDFSAEDRILLTTGDKVNSALNHSVHPDLLHDMEHNPWGYSEIAVNGHPQYKYLCIRIHYGSGPKDFPFALVPSNSPFSPSQVEID